MEQEFEEVGEHIWKNDYRLANLNAHNVRDDGKKVNGGTGSQNNATRRKWQK